MSVAFAYDPGRPVNSTRATFRTSGRADHLARALRTAYRDVEDTDAFAGLLRQIDRRDAA